MCVFYWTPAKFRSFKHTFNFARKTKSCCYSWGFSSTALPLKLFKYVTFHITFYIKATKLLELVMLQINIHYVGLGHWLKCENKGSD